MIKLTLAALLFVAPTMVGAQDVISAGEFLRRGEAMMKKRWPSPDEAAQAPKELMQQFVSAGERIRRAQDADRTAGRRPETCLPPKGEAKFDFRQFFDFIKTMPTPDQARPLDHALTMWSRKVYPCPA